MSIHTNLLAKMVRGIALSEDLRKTIIHFSNSGKSGCQIAKDMNLSRYTIRNIIKLHTVTGQVSIKSRLGSKPKASEANTRVLRRIAKSNRRSNCGELAQLWSDATMKTFSRSTTNRTLKKIGFGFYKVS